MDFAGALSSIGAALGIVKELSQINTALDAAEQKAKLAEVLASLADAKIALIDAEAEIRNSGAEVNRLREAFAYKGSLVKLRGFSFKASEVGKPIGMPFCPRREQNHGRFYHLTNLAGKSRLDFVCPDCKALFSGGGITSFSWDR